MKAKIIRVAAWLRWPNLLIIILTLTFIRHGLVGPALLSEGLSLQLNGAAFTLLCLITLLITFGGYVINDLYDQETDALNKPEQRVIGAWMSATNAKAIYALLFVIGLMLTIYLGSRFNKLHWCWIHPAAVLLLWIYARYLKGSVLIGNIIVSLMCSGVALLIPFSEMEPLKEMTNNKSLLHTLYFYAAFAGLSNFMRELIKDAQDLKGDNLSGLNTLAVRFGPNASRNWAFGICVLLLMGIVYFLNSRDYTSLFIFGFSFLTLPFLVFISVNLIKKATQINWKLLSNACKLLMIAGLFGLLFIL